MKSRDKRHIFPAAGGKKLQSFGSRWKINTSHGVQRGNFINQGSSHWSSLYFKLMKNRSCWHGSVPVTEWGAYWELFWFKEPQRGLAVSQPSSGLRRSEGRGTEGDRIPSASRVYVCVSYHMSVWELTTTLSLIEGSLRLLWLMPACCWRSSGRANWTDVKSQVKLKTLIYTCKYPSSYPGLTSLFKQRRYWNARTQTYVCPSNTLYKAPLIRFSPVWWGLPTPTERWLSFDSEHHCARLWHFLWLRALIFVWGFIRATLLKGICFYPSKQLSKVIGSQTFF